MKAMVHQRYGSLDELALGEIQKPVPGDHEVLVRVQAAGLHIGDCFGVRGAPFAMRLVSGVLKPKRGIPGFDLAGTVEAVGARVTRFKRGDEVFGAHHGTCVEYVTAAEDKLALKPTSFSFIEAASLPTSALAALHAVRDVGKVQPGQRVLINAASGGVGSFAVQIAKAFGAEVTGVCSSKNKELLLSIGADHVIDYTKEDFTSSAKRYDVILDNLENHSLSDCRRALTPTGMLILNSGTGAQGVKMLLRLIRPLVVTAFVPQRLRRYLSVPNQDDLVVLMRFAEEGKIRPVIDATYPLGETPAALKYIEAGHARGKVVVTL